MSAFYDLASLVLVPSGTKAQKIYAQKPLTTDGQLTFSRASTATRVASNGLIEKVRTNLLTYSNTFNNAAWVNSNITLTSGQQDPFGGTTGWRYLMTSVGASYLYYNNVTINATEMTLSFWVKSNTGSSQTFTATANSGGQSSPTFTATTSWQRFSWTFTSNAGNSNILLAYNGSTNCDLLIYGAQFETGVMTDYIATTSAAVSVGPVANVPRLDYLNSSCPRLLLEPQRTNLALYSEQFSNAAWTKRSNIAVTSNAITAPDGTLSADKIAASDNATVDYGVFDVVTSGLNTYSVFAKKGELNYVFVGKDNSFANDGVYFNLNTGAISSNPSSYSATITDYGNGWYRCSVYFATNVSYFFISPSVNGTSFSFSGQSGNGIYIWGAQVEAGAYATSYTPTLGAAVTRGADACYKTGISSLIGQTEGTIFVEAILTHSAPFNEYLVQVRGNNSNRFFIFRNAATNKLGCYALVGATEIYTTLTAAAITGTVKAAFAYKSGSFAFYVNGVQVGTSSATYSLATALTEFFIDQNNGLENGYYTYAQSIVFPTRLSNSDLAALTA